MSLQKPYVDTLVPKEMMFGHRSSVGAVTSSTLAFGSWAFKEVIKVK